MLYLVCGDHRCTFPVSVLGAVCPDLLYDFTCKVYVDYRLKFCHWGNSDMFEAETLSPEDQEKLTVHVVVSGW